MRGPDTRRLVVSNLSDTALAGLSDAELIALSRDGDAAAYGVLYERHQSAAHRAAMRVADPTLAKDVVAEAFTRTFSLLQRGGGPDVAFRPYLLAAVHNAFVSHVRTNSNMMWVEDHSTLPEVPATSDGTTERAESTVLARAFRSLPERWQTVLWHRCVERESATKLGELLGMSPNAVAALTFRAREGLRQAYLSEHIASAENQACRDIREMLPAYLRDDLGATKTARVADHLDSCVECAVAVGELEDIGSRMLGQMLAPAVLALLGSSLLNDAGPVSSAVPSTAVGERVAGQGLWVKGVAAATAALTLAAALVIMALSNRDGTETPQNDGPVAAAENTSSSDLVEQPPTPTPSWTPSTATPAPVAPPAPPSQGPREERQPDAPKVVRPEAKPPAAAAPARGHDLSVRQTSFTIVTDESGSRSNAIGMRVESPAVASSLTIVVKGLSAYQVRNGPNDVPATCSASTDGSGSDATSTINCRLQPGTGAVYLSVSVNAPTQLSASIAAPGNDDPDATDNGFTQSIS